LFAIPDEDAKENRLEISIPKLASLYLTHTLDGEVKGLDQFEGKHPPVAPVFWAFRIMVAVGMLMLFSSWIGTWQLAPWKKGSERYLRPWQAKLLVAMTFSGWVAVVAGWYTTEIGRQPWLVTGILTSADAASKVPTSNIALTLTMYLILYSALLIAYVKVVFHLARSKKYTSNPADWDADAQALQFNAETDIEIALNVVNYPEKERKTNG
ncbi:cytochrome ubiquinol oxidase subunit I, partial [Oxalobacteraceae sp. CFBP 13708]|nr:cytochrome ubiquinol oxidase subunit I [Oxalobacteraceae sp. CFBP 13708]